MSISARRGVLPVGLRAWLSMTANPDPVPAHWPEQGSGPQQGGTTQPFRDGAAVATRSEGADGGPAGARAANRRRVLAVVCVAWFLVLIDDTAVAVALPSLGRELGLSLSWLEWAVNLYTLAFAVLTLWGGMLADRIGTRPTFLAGLGVFTVSSFAAGLSPDGGTLVAMRAVQGAGAALMGPAALALLTTSFPGKARPLALGVWSGVGAAALAGGPLVGAALTSVLGWRSIFWINAPLGVAIWLGARRALPDPTPAPRAGRTDLAGGIAAAVGLTALIYALTQANTYGWGSARLWVLISAAVVGIAAFLVIERRTQQPLLDLSLFRRTNFLSGNILGMASLAVMCSVFFFLSLYLQTATGASALRAGTALLPLTLLGAAVAPAAGWLVPRVGAPLLIAVGMSTTAVGLVLLAGITPGWGAAQLQPGLLVTGLGIGLSTAPITTATLGHVPEERTGIASATLNAFRMIGLSLGVALMGAIVAAQWPGDLARTPPSGSAFTRGIAAGLLINAAIAGGAAVLAIATVRNTRRPRSGLPRA